MKKNLFTSLLIIPFILLSSGMIAGNHFSTINIFDRNESSVIKGQVFDSQTQLPLEFATVAFFTADSIIAGGATTNENGSFEIQDILYGEYIVKASFIGYKETKFKLTVNKDNINIGGIDCDPDQEMLTAAVKTAKRPIIEQKMDKIVMNVSEAATIGGTNADDVLKKAPGVTVDPDGNITLNGSKVEVWIDGRPSHLSGDALVALLQATNASTLDKIEIISHPSAKYDASGSGGIINIKTKKNFLKGLNGSVQLSYGGMKFDKYAQGADGSLNLSYRTDNTNTFLFYGPRYHEHKSQTESTTLFGTDYTMTQKSEDDADWTHTNHSWKVGNDWFINKNNTFGVIVDGLNRHGSYNNDKGGTTTFYQNAAGTYNPETEISKITSITNNAEDFNKVTANMNFTHVFNDKKDQEITTNFEYTRFDNNSVNSQNTLYQEGLYFGQLKDDEQFSLNSDQGVDIWTAKADYEQTIGKMGKLEAGAKWTLSTTDNNTIRMDKLETGWNENNTYTNNFVYKENVSSIYADYASMVGKWVIKAGLRGEYTYATGDWKTSNNESVKDYFNLFPTLYLGYNPNQNWRYGLSYTRRIQRPQYSQLNPKTTYISATSLMVGNPKLNPVFTHSLHASVGYGQHLNLALIYHHSTDMMTQTPSVDDYGINTMTWDNFGSQDMTGLSFGITELPITPWLYYNGNVFSSYISSKTTSSSTVATSSKKSNNGYFTTVYSNLTFMLPKDWKFEFGGTWHSSIPWGYFNIDPQYECFAGIKKNILNNRAVIALNIKDIFRSTDTFVNMQDENGVNYMTTNMYQNQQRVSISFSFNFGTASKIHRKHIGASDASRLESSSALDALPAK
ncbi:MAG: outer membrane beta-barrel family protein [Bacteroidales bacterium]